MSPIVRAELAKLSPSAQRSIRAWFANQVMILADVGMTWSPLIRGLAQKRQRYAEIAMEQFDELFPAAMKPDPNAHLGAKENANHR